MQPNAPREPRHTLTNEDNTWYPNCCSIRPTAQWHTCNIYKYTKHEFILHIFCYGIQRHLSPINVNVQFSEQNNLKCSPQSHLGHPSPHPPIHTHTLKTWMLQLIRLLLMLTYIIQIIFTELHICVTKLWTASFEVLSTIIILNYPVIPFHHLCHP